MVGAHHIWVNLCAGDAVLQLLARQPVVDTPANVAGTGICPVGPPGIGGLLVGVEGAEGVDKSSFFEGVKASALFIGEAVFADVRLWVCQVDLFVCDVEVAAEKHRLGLFEGGDVFKKRWIPLRVAEVQTREIVLRVWRVDGYHPKVIKFCRDDSTFVVGVAVAIIGNVMLGDDVIGKPVQYLDGFFFREDGGAAVAGFFSAIPVLVIFGEVNFSLALFCFGFLEAQNIRLVLGDERLKGALVDDGADAIDVP